MEIALISDLHANIEALDATLKDIEAQGVKKIFCLGDIIDYGPNPCEVLDIAIARFELNILGNHEEALMMVAEDFNERAMRSVDWTRDTINDPDVPRDKRHAYWNFLDGLAKSRYAKQGENLFLHGSPRQPTRDYVFPKDVKNTEKMQQIFAGFKGGVRYCFCGHSHIPGIYTAKGQYAHPGKIKGGEVDLSKFDKLLINIGSVGQPRDNDTRASYVILYDQRVVFRRVEYDFHATANKLRDIKRLPSFLAERLLVGK
ncbi:MAG: metallophosphoesterase family protein [Planctomycetaceae bacterium]|nr:metallophosphoesterase family protein [Planctomycetaceae bacterium]